MEFYAIPIQYWQEGSRCRGELFAILIPLLCLLLHDYLKATGVSMVGIQLFVGLIIVAFVIVCLVLISKRFVQYRKGASLELAKKLFSERREWVEADFWKIGTNSGKPRGLEWESCDFDSDVKFARDRSSGELTAFVGVSIKFRAVIGGGMEDVAAVANEKAATAVFRFNGKSWEATGKTVFNLNPTQAIEYYQNELESVQ